MTLLQMKRVTKSQKDQKLNQTGIPSYMKQDFEARSGLSYDDVRIHYSSPKPAELGALAYTQGSQVYIGPGQERHLPHELVHVAQQKRGEVRPTGRLGNVSVNDDPELERQADRGVVVQRAQMPSWPSSRIVQRKVGMEYQTVGRGKNVFMITKSKTLVSNTDHGVPLFTSNEIKVTADNRDLEYITPAVDTPDKALEVGRRAANIHQQLMTYANPPTGGLCSMGPEDIKNEVTSVSYCKYMNINKDAGKRSWECKTNMGDFILMNLSNSAHPQATVGIKMNRLYALLLYLGGSEIGEENKDQFGIVPLGLTTSRLIKMKEKTEYDEYDKTRESRSLLAEQKLSMFFAPGFALEAIRDYLVQHKEDKVKDYYSLSSLLSLLFAHNDHFLTIMNHPDDKMIAKDAMPVMNRTSLYDAYLTLDENDQIIFLHILQNELRLMWDEQTPEDAKRWRKADFVTRSEIPLAGQPDAFGGWETVSLEDWVKGLEDGQDAMYGHFHSIGGLASLKEGDSLFVALCKDYMLKKFGVERPTDIGNGENGLLVELRGLERGVPSERWGEIAWRVAFFVDYVNNQKKEDEKPDKSKIPDFNKM